MRFILVAHWHGWHAFRRGLATSLHAPGVDDKTIQAILRHSYVGLTMNVYVKSVSESQVSAMDALSVSLEICNDHATSGPQRIQRGFYDVELQRDFGAEGES